jgi:UDPglucose 6-dehydrogenase
MTNIGIIGKGFVGSAVAAAFSATTGYDGANIRIYDKDPLISLHSLEETVVHSDIIFISVPTPAKSDGSIDLSIIESVLRECNVLSKNNHTIFLVRSTVVPGTCKKFQKLYPKIKIVFNPEFLTERSAFFDFINQSRIILGGDSNDTKIVKALYRDRFNKHLPVVETNFATAELIKYMNNLFFATKISFLNEMYLVAQKVDANWEDAIDGFVLDGRVGHSHLNVPGPDGKYGFGGSCFPKDIQAMIHLCEKIGVEPNVLNGVWQTNLAVRSIKDWEELKGRAVSDDNQ